MSYQDELRKFRILQSRFNEAESYYAQLHHSLLSGRSNVTRARVDRARENVEEIKRAAIRQRQVLARMAPQSAVRNFL